MRKQQMTRSPFIRWDQHVMALSLATAAAGLGAVACSGQLDGNMSQEDTAMSEQAYFSTYGSIFIAGKDLDGSPLAICNSQYEDGLHPGKARGDFRECRFAWGSGVQKKQSYRFVDPSYVPSTQSDIWNRSIALGYEANQTERLYTCLAVMDGGLYAGKTSPALGSCRIARGELEFATISFELIGSFAADPEAPPFAKATKSSSLAWSALRIKSTSRRYCLARRVDNGMTSEHPGWEQDGVCHYAYGAGAQHEPTNFSYLIPRFSNPGSGFFKAGNESDGSPLGACRIEHPANSGAYQVGKYLPALNECHFEYADRLQVKTTGFQVLK